MPFSKEEFPPFVNKIINAMEKNGGSMTTEEFIDLIIRLRFTKHDIHAIRNWLNLNGYIIINGRKIIMCK